MPHDVLLQNYWAFLAIIPALLLVVAAFLRKIDPRFPTALRLLSLLLIVLALSDPISIRSNEQKELPWSTSLRVSLRRGGSNLSKCFPVTCPRIDRCGSSCWALGESRFRIGKAYPPAQNFPVQLKQWQRKSTPVLQTWNRHFALQVRKIQAPHSYSCRTGSILMAHFSVRYPHSTGKALGYFRSLVTQAFLKIKS